MLKYRFYKTLRFFHFISKKKFKKRTAKYTEEYKLLAKSRLFDKKWYLATYTDVKSDPISHYLNIGWKEKRQPSLFFDGNKYLDTYFDVKDANINPLVHYERFGKKEKRKLYFQKQKLHLTIYEIIIYQTLNILKKLHFLSLEKHETITKRFIYSGYRSIYKSPLFNKKWYCIHYGRDNFTDAVDHYLHIGFKLGYNPSKYFDNDYYLTNNPDILFANINPLYHYEESGKYEQRSIANLENIDNHYDDIIKNISDKSILLVSHELSLTGAPIALMNMAKVLQKQGLNPIILSPQNGELEKDLNENSLQYIVEPYLLVKLYRREKYITSFLEAFPAIVFNTIDTLKYAGYIHTNNRKICWVHEGEFGYRCAEGAFSLENGFKNIDEVYSVGEYSKSFTDKYIPSEKSKILLYGIENIACTEISGNNKKITFGIFGVCCERKGTNLFVEAVKKLPQKIKNNCTFKIIGRIDNNEFCDNLKDIAKNENIIFTGQLSHEDTLKEMKNLDVVVCPSLDDPMPIVCTEAMLLKKVVICSNKTGTASFIQNGINGYIYNLETDNLSQIIIDAYNNKTQFDKLGNKWHQVYLDNFTNDIFEKNIISILGNSRKSLSNEGLLKELKETISSSLKNKNLYSHIERLPFKNYDLICPLGRSCHCSMMLRSLGLQKQTYPFDWSRGIIEEKCGKFGLEGKINLICNNFQNFIKESDLVEFIDTNNTEHRSVFNRETGLQYVHDFPWDKTITEEFPNFYEKYIRRKERLIRKIQDSKTIAFMWIQDTWDQISYPIILFSNDELIRIHNTISCKFPDKAIDFILFEHDENIIDDEIQLSIINEHIYRFKSNHRIEDKNLYDVKWNKYHIKSIMRVLTMFSLNNSQL